MKTSSHFLIAAPSSNSGKTTLTLGLLRALKNKGMHVQPFKCGPDYIDPIHHTQAAGNASVNLDTFMASQDHVSELYSKYGKVADVCVTEGVMGLFDGADRMQGSSAAIAGLLDIPVILVINAKSMAYSAAPLLYGFKNFYPGIRVVGAIFNFVNSESHYRFLQEACEDVGIEALGYLPKNENIAIASRHLGLHFSSKTDYESIIANLALAVSETIDIDRLLEITQRKQTESGEFTSIPGQEKLRITIAKDEAFSFTYQQNIEILSRLGTITWFSPIHDSALPDTDFLYLPGGYPELFAEKLSANQSMLSDIKRYCDGGGLAYAECGGMMYLGNELTDKENKTFKMAGVLNLATTMSGVKMTLGYRVARWNNLEFRGHEFHYSAFAEQNENAVEIKVSGAKGVEVATPFYRKNNTFATYMHVYWGEQAGFIEELIQECFGKPETKTL
jgi:cobyrinic acid a,c-diamide synthase